MPKPDHAVWHDVLSYLRTNHPDTCRQWFEEIEPVGIDGGVFKGRVDQDVRQRYLQRQCAAQFTEALQAVTGKLLAVQFIVRHEEIMAPAHSQDSSGVDANGAARPAAHNGKYAPDRRCAQGGIRQDGLVISPDHAFEHFIVGPENRLAHAASLAVCANPGRTYNPLFVHGGVGLGKTHLLQAVCLKLLSLQPTPVIYYVSCDEFMTQYLDAVQDGKMNDFRHRFRDVDVLLIDDIHFLAKRDKTQDEFFHTFNALYQTEKQIVLSSDAPPNEIPDLEARLISRFQCGLVVQMNPPCYETRVQIVKQKAKIRGMDFSDDIACYIASRVSSNIRELEGAIVKVHMQHSADGRPIDLALARTALDPGMGSVRAEISIMSITDTVISFYGVKLTDLQSKRRQKSIAHPRQVCMYLARRNTRFSLEEIGGHFGGRDHTTVMHAVKTIERRRDEDPEFGRVLEALEERVKVPGAGPRPLAAAAF